MRPSLRRGLAALALVGALSSPSPAADDLQQWTTLLLINRFDEQWSGMLLAQGRFNQDISNAQVFLLRPEVSYNVSPEVQLTLGFDYFDRLDRGRPTEYRVWEQLGIGHEMGPIGLTNRLRVEQRFIDGVEGPSVRMRYRLRGQGWVDDDKRWMLFASNEIFYTINDVSGGPPVGFNQNRLQAGVGYHLHEGLRVEPGYQWTAGRGVSNQVLLLTFRVDLQNLTDRKP